MTAGDDTMRTASCMLAAGALCVIGTVSTSAQSAGPSSWCAQYEEIGRNCGFATLQQCVAAQIGNGGYCEPNPLGALPMPPPERAKRPRRTRKG
jgi:Protein of unknown function (DUF3551)